MPDMMATCSPKIAHPEAGASTAGSLPHRDNLHAVLTTGSPWAAPQEQLPAERHLAARFVMTVRFAERNWPAEAIAEELANKARHLGYVVRGSTGRRLLKNPTSPTRLMGTATEDLSQPSPMDDAGVGTRAGEAERSGWRGGRPADEDDQSIGDGTDKGASTAFQAPGPWSSRRVAAFGYTEPLLHTYGGGSSRTRPRQSTPVEARALDSRRSRPMPRRNPPDEPEAAASS